MATKEKIRKDKNQAKENGLKISKSFRRNKTRSNRRAVSTELRQYIFNH